MNAKKLLLPLLAATAIAAAPCVALASDGEKPLPCPRHMIGCEHGAPHKVCPQPHSAQNMQAGQKNELSEEQKAEMKAKCEARKAKIAEKRAEFAKKKAERKAQRDKLVKEHHEAAAPLYEKLIQKKMELEALSPNPNVKPEELKALVSEILSLRKELRSLKGEFRKEMAKLGKPRSKRFHGPEYSVRPERCPRFFHGERPWQDACTPRCPRSEGRTDGPRMMPAPHHGSCEGMR